MADYPAMPLWTDAYLADTRHLSTLEHGAYLLLMMEAWRRPACSLPDNDAVLARLAGLSEDEWASIKPIIMTFWTYDGRSKTWHQKRQRKERDYVSKKSRSQKEKAAKRWSKTKKDDARALPNVCRDDAPTPTPTPIDPPISPKGGKTTDLGLVPEPDPKPEKSRKRRSLFPADWTPDEALIGYGEKLGFSAADVRLLGEKCRDHHRAKGSTFLDHAAAFQNWLRNEVEFRQRSGRPVSSAPAQTGKYRDPQLNAIMRHREARLKGLGS